jgi:hypothetical protein
MAYNLEMGADHITLTHMHLATVSFVSGLGRFTTISHCLITGVVRPGASGLPQEVLISQNLFDHGFLSLDGDNADVTAVDNVFNQGGLSDSSNGDAVFRGNQFVGGDAELGAVAFQFAGTSAAPVVFQDNEILLTTPGITAIQIDLVGHTSVNVLNNRIYTGYNGTAININEDNGTDQARVLIQGNDFQGNRVGVSFTTGSIPSSNRVVDLGSLGGNDFRGFTSPATSTAAAISFSASSMMTLNARNNIFSAGVDPNSLINDATHGSSTGAGTIDVSTPLSQAQAFVQTLYNHVLGRTASRNELSPWVRFLAARGQPAVVDGILYSPESLGRIVDGLYTRLLDRDADPSGLNEWTSFLAAGGSVEEVENIFVTSPEYLSKNTNWVGSLYNNILNRPGMDQEISAWTSVLPSLGLSAVASAFTHSTEAGYLDAIGIFRAFLHRAPTPAEVTQFVAMPINLLGLEHFVLGSPEYFANG